MKKQYSIKDFPFTQEALALQETIFHNANGYLGIRGCMEEGVPEEWDTMRGTYINGFYDIVPMKQAEKLYMLVEDKEAMINVSDVQSIYLTFGEERFSMLEGEILEVERVLDMERGITSRNMVWRSPQGKELEICFKRMVSFEQLSLFTIECSIVSRNFTGVLTIESLQKGLVKNYYNPNDPRLAGESHNHLLAGIHMIEGEEGYLVSHTAASGLNLCSGVRHTCSTNYQMKIEYLPDQHQISYTYTIPMEVSEEISFVKYSVFTDSIRNEDTIDAAQAEMEKTKVSLQSFYDKQREHLDLYWKDSEMEIEGDDDLNISVCFNLYQLFQSVGKDGICSIAAKGLSGEGYEGHYFWDTEMYMMPFFTLTNPEISRELLTFRHRTLEKAKENAKCLGHKKGALYPWRTITGRECSGYFPSGSAQYHINGDIAYAVVSYYIATDDYQFMKEKGAEILLETARLWQDVGVYYEGTFRINAVTGPDEYTCLVNNNYYTNACAKYNLEWAVKFIRILQERGDYDTFQDRLGSSEEELVELKRAADHMYLPYDEKKRINPQDDSFLEKPVWDIKGTPKENFPLLLHYHPLHLYRYQVCKQADTVLSYFIFEDLQSQETIRNSFLYYENVTTHDSSLSTCIFSIVASRLGMNDKAYSYFGESAKIDLLNTHGNTKDGIHTANMGGCYMAIVYGFAGLKIKEDGLYLNPNIPQQWKSYRFRFRYMNRLVQFSINQAKSTLTLLEGEPLKINISGRWETLTLESPLEQENIYDPS